MQIAIQSLDDPRIAHYRNLKDRDLAADGDRFIAEGELVVRRLLASPLPVESVLLAEHQAPDIGPLAPADVPVFVAPAAQVNRIIGFKFHSGVMAVARRPALPTLDAVAAGWQRRVTLAILPHVTSTENLGSLMRIGAGFGVDAMLLGPHCCDPYYRQSVRVSMGAVFSLKIVRSRDLLADLADLRGRFGVELLATVLHATAEPLAGAARPDRIGLLFGNEAQGLSAELIAACDRALTIPMHLGTDSLNVAVAAGIFLHHFTRTHPPNSTSCME